MIKIGIIGAGYVGLPLAICFSKKFKVRVFDVSKKRINDLSKGNDKNNECKKKDILNKNISYFTNIKELHKCNFFIVTVPTPVNDQNIPDLTLLKLANFYLSKILKKNDIIVYESTVYPGVTNNVCVKQIERLTKLKKNKDIFFGYSPERVNPGDKKREVKDIIKVVSGSDKKTLFKINQIYRSVIKAGTFRAESIEVAEAAKVIENTQRDLNIALINELSIIFDRMNIDIFSVLKTASTKWNFLKFEPGLVGGHCISVDPYYLSFISKKFGVNPKVILAGRGINDQYYKFISKKILSYHPKKVLILGITFKENCKDIRNSQIPKVYFFLKKIKKIKNIDIFDPIADYKEVKNNYKINLLKKIKKNNYDLIVSAVKHNYFKKQKSKILQSMKSTGKVFHLKKIL
jgi:UDP-N-acetyl-D-galactosamine dehydrogenase